MSDFHAIIAESFDNAETSALRRFVVDWYYAKVWSRTWHNMAFAVMWQNGSFDALEARCEEMANRS